MPLNLKAVKEVKKQINRPPFNMNLFDIECEIIQIFRSRTMRTLTAKEMNARKVADAVLTNNGARSRLAEMSMKTGRVLSKLRALKTASAAAFIEDNYSMFSSMSATARREMVEHEFVDLMKLIIEYEGIENMLDRALRDADASSWGLKSVADVMIAASKSEMKI